MGNRVSQPKGAQHQQPESWSISDNQIVQFTHHWAINNFNVNLYTSMDHPRIDSPFSPPNDDTTQFFFSLYPNGKNEQEKYQVKLYLYLISCLKPELRVYFRVSILDKDNNKQNDLSLTETFKTKGGGWGNAKSLVTHAHLLKNLDQLLPDGKLTLVCEIKIILDSVFTSGRNHTFQPMETKIVDSLSRLFESQKLSDVILVTGDTAKTEHRAHKAILSAQSAVFAAMFEHDTKESREGRVEIEDIEPKVITEMLRFIYTGKVRDFGVLAAKLLIAADKYELDELKSQCEQYIMCKLTPEIVVDCLFIGDIYSADKLRAKSIEYINANLSAIMKTDKWKAIEDQPEFYIELFSMIMVDKVKIK